MPGIFNMPSCRYKLRVTKITSHVALSDFTLSHLTLFTSRVKIVLQQYSARSIRVCFDKETEWSSEMKPTNSAFIWHIALRLLSFDLEIKVLSKWHVFSMGFFWKTILDKHILLAIDGYYISFNYLTHHLWPLVSLKAQMKVVHSHILLRTISWNSNSLFSRGLWHLYMSRFNICRDVSFIFFFNFDAYHWFYVVWGITSFICILNNLFICFQFLFIYSLFEFLFLSLI